MRRKTQKDWINKLHGETTQSVDELAWVTKKNKELGKAKGEGTITAFLDCSKCYERVSHDVAFERTIQTGCNPTIADLVLDLYKLKEGSG